MSIEAGIGLEIDLGGRMDDMHRDIRRGMRAPRPVRKVLGVGVNSGATPANPLLLEIGQGGGPANGRMWEIIQVGSFSADGHSDLTVAVPNPVTLAATTVASYNNNPAGVNVTVTGGTVTVIAVNGTVTGLTSGTVYVPAGGTLAITYTVAPTLTSAFPSLNGTLISSATAVLLDLYAGQSIDPNLADFSAVKISGLLVGSIYNVGHKKIWVKPQETVYGLVYGIQPSLPVSLVICVDEWPVEDVTAMEIG
jgi:hypothetical protein